MTSYGPYSPIKQAGNFFFVSGQVGIKPNTLQAGADIATQTEQVLENLNRLLNEQGLTLDDVIKTTVFLTDMNSFGVMNEIYLSYFKEPRPARACVEVTGLPKLADNKLLVEIEAVAYKS